MLRAALFALAMATALPAYAYTEALHEGEHWRDCADDNDCIAVMGRCGLTGVNIASREEAAHYYRLEAAKTQCVDQFWKPKAEVPRCYLGQCETIPKQAAKPK